MSYSTDLEAWDLRCLSLADAESAAEVIEHDPFMSKRMTVSPRLETAPGDVDVWHLSIDSFDPCYWNDDAACRVWCAIAPFMADGSSMEFCNEDRERFRVRWSGQRAFVDVPKEIVWELETEL